MPAQKKPAVFEYHLTRELGVSAKKVSKCLLKPLGQKVEEGELVAQKKGLLGKKTFLAPVTGILDSLTEKGVLRIRVKTDSSKRTKKKPVFTGDSIELKGDWGKGDSGSGKLFCLGEKATVFNLKEEHEGQILALPDKLSWGLWHKAKTLGVEGIICGQAPDEEFEKELEKEVLVLTKEKRDLTIPVVVLGKDARIPEDLWQILKTHQGKKVFLEGDEARILIPK